MKEIALENFLYFLGYLVIFLLRCSLESRLKPKDKYRNIDVNEKKSMEGRGAVVFVAVMYIISAASVLVSILFFGFTSALFTSAIMKSGFFIGIALVVFTFLGRMWILHQVGNSFSIYLNTNESDRLVTDGVYGYVRHPAYLLFSTEMFALVLIRFNYISLVAFILDLTSTLIRIRREEFYLLERYGETYKRYSEKTKRFIPFVW